MAENSDNKSRKLTLNKVIKTTISGREGASVAVERKKTKIFISDDKAKKLQQILAQAEEEQTKEQEEAKKEQELRKKREELILQEQKEREAVRKKLAEQQTQTEDEKEIKKTDKKPIQETDSEKEKSGKPNLKDNKRQNKLSIKNISFANDDDYEDEEQVKNFTAFKKAKEKERQKHSELLKSHTEKLLHEITLPEVISVKELANRMAEKTPDVIKKLMQMGLMVTINEMIDADTAELIATELGHSVKRVTETDIEEEIKDKEEDQKDLKPRAPVVTIMGHVDHGKTSLLDALRETDVASKEAGGITQHIGAYQVTLKNQKQITFIDTPGHEAFSSMRARGANVTDIVVLVVAANDGIMPQTKEAINHAKAGKVPIIVAINKIDLPDANPNKVRTELLSQNVIVEEMGGEVLSVEVSAKQHTNLNKLEEAILLQSEMLNLKSNPNRSARGTVIESQMEKGLGAIATILIQKGTLKIGDIFVSGASYGKVRALYNDKGQKTNEAIPATPIRVLGFNTNPAAGDDFVVLESEGKARQIAELRYKRTQDKALAKSKTTLQEVFETIKAGESMVTLSIIIKADVQGSIEALKATLDKIKSDKAKINIIHTAVGGINESDINLAKASNAAIIGFNVRSSVIAQEIAKRDGIDMRYYSIIYDVENDIRNLLSGMIAPEIKEKIIGYAEIIEVFKISGTKIAGTKVTNGIIKRNAKARLIRDNIVIHTSAISQLKHFKEDIKEAREGFECGISFDNYQDIQVGDKIECFEFETVKVEL